MLSIRIVMNIRFRICGSETLVFILDSRFRFCYRN